MLVLMYKKGMKMKRAIVTGGTKSDVAAMAVFALNIQKTNADLFDKLVIFHDGISAKNQKLIQRIMDTEFVRYHYPNKTKNDEVVNNFSEMVFCKYECFRLLSEYDVVVWSDYDVVIKGSIAEICEFGEQTFNIIEDKKSFRDMFYKNILSGEVKKYDLNRPGLCTPIFALSNRLNAYKEIYDWCYEKTRAWDADLYLPEQCIFGLAVQEFGINTKAYSYEKYVCLPALSGGDELIIHAAGHPKFWEGLHNDMWEEMYAEWLGMGGSKYHHGWKSLKKKITFLLSRMKGMRGRKTL